MKDRYGNQLNHGDQILLFENGKFEGISVFYDHAPSWDCQIVRVESILPALEKLKKIEELVNNPENWKESDHHLFVDELRDILRGEL